MTDAPKPGRALDLLVAEKVLGWFWIRYAGSPEKTCDGTIRAILCSPEEWEKFLGPPKYMKDDGKYPRETDPSWGRLPRFSTDRGAALTLLDHFVKDGFGTVLEMGREMGFWASVGPHKVEGDSPAHAICLAALMATEAVSKGTA